MSDTTKRTDGAGPGYEVSDANVRPLLKWGAILAVVTAGSFALMTFFVAILTDVAERTEEAPPPMMATGLHIPPEPRLQWSPNDDLTKSRAAEEKRLESYGWVEKDDQIAHIPIERAIEILAERGLPARGSSR
ncbi:MAG: hypothetical protein ACREQJ_03920 [Candidatus Binatia bacterium]